MTSLSRLQEIPNNVFGKSFSLRFWHPIAKCNRLVFGLFLSSFITNVIPDFLGPHGLSCKNNGGFEEAYNIPVEVAGPNVAADSEVSDARVGLQDVGKTFLELVGAQPLDGIPGRAFAPLPASPLDTSACQQGYAEYYGRRYVVSQRLLWNGD